MIILHKKFCFDALKLCGKKAISGRLRKHTSTQDIKWPASRVRQTFIEYFVRNYDHKFVPSSSVVPRKGDGVYFCNAGMNQFKPLFIGNVMADSEMAQYRRVVNSQKCIRIGGKHNDFEAVGHDFYHHTFFEMLGNWSFFDYYKEQACKMALELLTLVYGIPMDQLYVTYFGGDEALNLEADTEVLDIWLNLGISPSRLLPFGAHDNFWEMGNTGPCGPCTEIHYDHIGNGRDASSLVNQGSHDVVELWNLVFMQFDRQQNQILLPLKGYHVDTGLGLERLTAILQNRRSNYDTDLFTPLFDHICQNSGVPQYQGKVDLDRDIAYRIAADHARMMTVAISDGLMPAKRGLGHKLRHVIHRCIRTCGKHLGSKPGFISSLVDVVVDSLGGAFPELEERSTMVKGVIADAEMRYYDSVQRQNDIYQKSLDSFSGDISQASDIDIRRLLRHCADIIEDLPEIGKVVKERGIEESQTQDSLNKLNRPALLSGEGVQYLVNSGHHATDDSHKYSYCKADQSSVVYTMDALHSEVLAVLSDGKIIKNLVAADDIMPNSPTYGVITRETNFYAEAGGQSSDTGIVTTQDGEFEVSDVQSYAGYVIHIGRCTAGRIAAKNCASLFPNMVERTGCARNHSATHILDMALQQTLGPEVTQCGSSITPSKFTFDFTYPSSEGVLTHLQEIEDYMRWMIERNLDVFVSSVPRDEALMIRNVQYSKGEVYPNTVRVVSVGAVPDLVGSNHDTSDISVELCTGTHVLCTADIKDFCITKCSSIGQGTTRITAVTHDFATLAWDNYKKSVKLLDTVKNDLVDFRLRKETIKQIDTFLSQTIFPKSQLSPVKKQLKGLKMTLGHDQNASNFDALVMNLENVIGSKSSAPFICCQLDFVGINQVIRVIRQVSMDQAIAVTNHVDDDVISVLHLPQEHIRSSAIEVVKFIARETDSKYRKILKKNREYYVLSNRRPSQLDSMMQSIERALQDTTNSDSSLHTHQPL